MGWSIDTARIELNRIFREAKRSYRLTRPQSAQISIVVEYATTDTDDDLNNRFKQRIIALFPDFVYIDFIPVPVKPEVSEQMHWDYEVK